jgi:hypothetical protein
MLISQDPKAGWRYEGEFQNDKFNGKGTLSHKDGLHTKSGKWANGVFRDDGTRP